MATKGQVMKRTTTAALVLCGLLPLQGAAQGREQGSPDTVKRVTRLLEGSGFAYSKLTDAAWSVNFKGEFNDSVRVLMYPERNNLIVLSVIADKKLVDESAPALRQLLKINGKLPEQISVMMDNDEDYIVQSRHVLKDLNAESFKNAVEAIAAASDDAYGAIRSFIGKAPAG